MPIKNAPPNETLCKRNAQTKHREDELSQIGAANPLVNDKANGLDKKFGLLDNEKNKLPILGSMTKPRAKVFCKCRCACELVEEFGTFVEDYANAFLAFRAARVTIFKGLNRGCLGVEVVKQLTLRLGEVYQLYVRVDRMPKAEKLQHDINSRERLSATKRAVNTVDGSNAIIKIHKIKLISDLTRKLDEHTKSKLIEF